MVFDTRAYLALLLYVPVALSVVVSLRSGPLAIAAVYLGGLLFLPELVAFDLPLLPPLDKNGMAAVLAFVGLLLVQRDKLRRSRPLRGVEVFFWIVMLGNVGTVFTNGDAFAVGNDFFRPEDGVQLGFRHVLPGMTKYDIASTIVRDVIAIYLPFFVARVVFRNRADGEALLKAMVLFGVVYVPLMLIEMRLSPQLHNWFYGYTPNKFLHSIRGSGYKPTVFLNNGLPVAMFMLSSTIAAACLFKRRVRVAGIPAIAPFGLVWVVLALSRNVGATLYSIAALPIVFFSRGKLALRVSFLLALATVAYPALRATEALPVHDAVEKIAEYSEERAQSLGTRFVNEDVLYERASERLWFGWGGFGRNRIFDDWGRDISITDGEWIIRIGMRGVVGFIGSFGLLLWPVVMARRCGARIADAGHRGVVDALALIVALNVVDLLPNGLFTQMPYFLAGALAGLSQGAVALGRARTRQGEYVVRQIGAS